MAQSVPTFLQLVVATCANKLSRNSEQEKTFINRRQEEYANERAGKKAPEQMAGTKQQIKAKYGDIYFVTLR